MIYVLLLLAVSVSSCASMQYVDAKGRDCRDNQLLAFFRWTDCGEKQEPLATTRQEIKLDADVKQTQTNSEK